MEALAFLGLLGLGLVGWWGLMRWSRDNAWWMRAAAVLCFFGLTGAGRWMPDVMETSPIEQRDATRPSGNATQSSDVPFIAFDTRWGPERENEYLDRYAVVVSEIGPPPIPGAVPVLGYVDKSGKEYRPRWRMPPNADTADNLKQ